MPQIDIHELVTRLQARKQAGAGWMAKCPAHEDSTASLKIDLGRNGGIVLHCHAGCDNESVCKSLGIETKDLQKQKSAEEDKPKSVVVATYDYTDETGELLYQVVRYSPKQFRQRRPDLSRHDKWNWSIKDVRLVPYRLPEVLKTQQVFIVEGEKDADNAAALGIVATCNNGGALKWTEDHAKQLKDKDVCIIVDGDVPGREHGLRVAGLTRKYAKSIRVTELPGAKDLSDWIAAGGTKDVLLAFFEEVKLYEHRDLPELTFNDKGQLRASLANAIALLEGTPHFEGAIRQNEFTLYVETAKALPWKRGERRNWTDYDSWRMLEWFQHADLNISSPAIAYGAVETFAFAHRYHPVKDYLNSIQWDGAERLKTWLHVYAGAEQVRYAAEVGIRWMISAIARIMQPGCQADHVLVLEGPQGIRKSTLLRTLASAEWFSDRISDLHSKDAMIELHGVWILELAELAATRRSDIERVKAFLTACSDVFRAPYGRTTDNIPRTTVFAATTNDYRTLTDETGGRRFWPVRCGKIDIAAVKRDRDQLWAEAYAKYKGGYVWWIDDDDLNKTVEEEQEKRYETGPWDDYIRKHIAELPVFTEVVKINDILIGLGKRQADITHGDHRSVAKYLKHEGWIPGRDTDEARTRVWRKNK